MAALLRQDGDFIGVQMHRVHRDQVGAEQAQILQALHRPELMLLQALLDFVLGFVQVDMDRQVELLGIGQNLAEGFVADSVGGVRARGRTTAAVPRENWSRIARPLCR